jgi:hypothetical protein
MFYNRRNVERFLFSKHIPEFTPESADVLRTSAYAVLSTQLKSSHDVVRPDQRVVSHGQGVAQVLGYDSTVMPHLTIFKTSLLNPVSPILEEPAWLGGYSLRPFPEKSVLSQHENLIVSGIRHNGDVRELYYGSHPDSSLIDPNTGVITPDSKKNRLALGVLSSPLDPTRRSKLRFWISPYEIDGEEWRSRLIEDQRLNDHLFYEGTLKYDGFTRHSYVVEKSGLAQEATSAEEHALISTIAPTFGIAELCRVQLGKDSWHVYASGNVRAPVAVRERAPRRTPVLYATAQATMAAATR